jgi:hypothetical protein
MAWVLTLPAAILLSGVLYWLALKLIRRCERVRRQFILTSALCGLVLVSMIALLIWH